MDGCRVYPENNNYMHHHHHNSNVYNYFVPGIFVCVFYILIRENLTIGLCYGMDCVPYLQIHMLEVVYWLSKKKSSFVSVTTYL